jgi:ABC-type amino acid transport substrate-binding protein
MRKRKALAALGLAATLAAAACGGGAQSPGGGAGNVREAEKVANEGRATGPMPDGAFRAAITVADPPTKMRPGEKQTLNVKVKNTGNAPWTSHGRSGDGFYQVNLGDIWFDAQNTRVEKHPYVRSPLPGDVKPGDEVEVPLTITAPAAPGDYTLQVDLVQEMVSWFADKGSSAPKFKVKVGG